MAKNTVTIKGTLSYSDDAKYILTESNGAVATLNIALDYMYFNKLGFRFKIYNSTGKVLFNKFGALSRIPIEKKDRTGRYMEYALGESRIEGLLFELCGQEIEVFMSAEEISDEQPTES